MLLLVFKAQHMTCALGSAACADACFDISLLWLDCRPEEYPSSLEGLYHSSPDEALPQFYTDPVAFASKHHNMTDLAVPEWAQDAADFVRLHRWGFEFQLCLCPSAGLVN